jgi:hypothetical protein
MALPQNVIAEERRLDKAVSNASESLAKLRWHWTLDESNPKRVALREYARETGRTRRIIEAYAYGYARWKGGDAGVATLAEAIERAKMGSETAAATEAVAAQRGLSIKQTRTVHASEVRRVREQARERAERRKTTVEEEIPTVMAWREKAARAAEREKVERKRRYSPAYFEAEAKLDRARREIAAVARLAVEMDWADQEQELLQTTLANIKSLLKLVDAAVTGTSGTDWDGDLRRLTEV